MFNNPVIDIWKNGKVIINGWLSIPNSFTAEAMSKMGWDSLTNSVAHANHGTHFPHTLVLTHPPSCPHPYHHQSSLLEAYAHTH